MPSPNAGPRLQRRLDYLREHWKRLSPRNLAADCTHPRTTLFVQIARNGSKQLYEGCATCTLNTSGRFLPHDSHDLDTLPVGSDRTYENPPCEVCGQFGTERHHWAPQAVFGSEADHWPASWLCVACHTEWHQRTGVA